MMANKAKETKKLLEDLQVAQEDLQTKEDELNELEDNLTRKQKQHTRTEFNNSLFFVRSAGGVWSEAHRWLFVWFLPMK